jgi:hypothetical protein
MAVDMRGALDLDDLHDVFELSEQGSAVSGCAGDRGIG